MLANGSTAMEGVFSPGVAIALSSAARTSLIVWNRSTGDFRKQRVTMAETFAGASSTAGSSRKVAEIVSTKELAANGWRPLSISYSTTPKEKMSERASMSSPFACSGDI